MPSNARNEGYGTSINPKQWAPMNGETSKVIGIPSEEFRSEGKDHDKKERHDYSRHISTTSVRQIGGTHTYFTEFTIRKAFFYGVATLFVACCGLASFAELFLDLPCAPEEDMKTYANPDYDASRCPHIRQPLLLFLTPTECSFGRRLVSSIMMGGLIGWERRQADRPAGIRTMSLVSLGSCLFTINSAFAFKSGPMEWDASRISAAIPSGVGFLGAGLIFKKTGDDEMVVHGLTTAASVWLSAAVGIACGGCLYFAAFFGTCLMMLLLRFGPRGHDMLDDDDESDDDEDEEMTNFYDTMSKLEMPRRDGGHPILVTLNRTDGHAERKPGVDTVIFRNADGEYKLPPGSQMTSCSTENIHSEATRSNDAARSNDDGNPSMNSIDGSYTLTGDSLEASSLIAETTPMLGTQTPLSPPRLTNIQYVRTERRKNSKNSRFRKRSSRANLGSIV